MTIIVKGTDKPKTCLRCMLKVYDYLNEQYMCPFLQIPAKHRGKHEECPIAEADTGRGEP